MSNLWLDTGIEVIEDGRVDARRAAFATSRLDAASVGLGEHRW
jgi:hypothetical protein